MKRQMIGVLSISLSLLFLFACSHGLGPEEEKQVETLRSELEVVHKEVVAAQSELSKYTGGLIQSLLLVRIEIIKTTEALIQQRIQAIEGKAPVSIQTLASKQDPDKAEKLAAEISKQEQNSAKQRLKPVNTLEVSSMLSLFLLLQLRLKRSRCFARNFWFASSDFLSRPIKPRQACQCRAIRK